MADEDLGHKLQALQHSWRQVASTHNLQDLLQPDVPHPPSGQPRHRRLQGALLVSASFATAAFATWVLVVHFMPLSSSRWVRVVQQDWYYCSLVPLTLPVAAFVVAINWFSLKLFKHNS